jgi:glycerol transport system ATP-binding protein
MNVLPCQVSGSGAVVAGHKVATANKAARADGTAEIGVRPEFVSFATSGLPARVAKVSDAGRFSIVEADCDAGKARLLVGEGGTIPSEQVHLAFDPARTRIYVDGWLAGREARS